MDHTKCLTDTLKYHAFYTTWTLEEDFRAHAHFFKCPQVTKRASNVAMAVIEFHHNVWIVMVSMTTQVVAFICYSFPLFPGKQTEAMKWLVSSHVHVLQYPIHYQGGGILLSLRISVHASIRNKYSHKPLDIPQSPISSLSILASIGVKLFNFDYTIYSAMITCKNFPCCDAIKTDCVNATSIYTLPGVANLCF